MYFRRLTEMRRRCKVEGWYSASCAERLEALRDLVRAGARRQVGEALQRQVIELLVALGGGLGEVGHLGDQTFALVEALPELREICLRQAALVGPGRAQGLQLLAGGATAGSAKPDWR